MCANRLVGKQDVFKRDVVLTGVGLRPLDDIVHAQNSLHNSSTIHHWQAADLLRPKCFERAMDVVLR
jgi:hypothetical protein